VVLKNKKYDWISVEIEIKQIENQYTPAIFYNTTVADLIQLVEIYICVGRNMCAFK